MASNFLRLTSTNVSRYLPSHHVLPIYMAKASKDRRAMMSAIASPGPSHSQSQPPLHDSPPVVIPSENVINANAASPQVAARPPKPPQAERPKPKLRSTKAALTLVSPL